MDELLNNFQNLIDDILVYFGIGINHYNDINYLNDIIRNIVLIYILAFVLYLILRIIVYTGFQMILAKFYLNSKEIKSVKDIKDTKSKFLNRIIKTYVKSAEKGISHIDTNAIVENQILKLNLLGWRYKSIENFLIGFEYIFLISGILFWIAFNNMAIFLVIAVISFILIKIINSIFDYSIIEIRLLSEIILYVEREIGQFFVTDLAFSVQNFKMEMKEVFNEQTKTLNDSVLKMGTDIANAVVISNKELNENIDKTIKSLFSITDILEKPLIEWKNSLEQSIKTHKDIDDTFSKINSAALNFENVTSELSKKLELYSSAYEKYESKVNKEIAELTSITEKLIVNNQDNSKVITSVSSQIQYIEKNQSILKESIQKYEITLENITKQIGEALGGIIEYQMKNSYENISQYIKDDVNKITNSSHELILQLDELFGKMVEQSRNETTAVLKLKEQIDMYFEKNSDN